VQLNIADDSQLKQAWERLHGAIRQSRPDLVVDGTLVEAMSSGGIEMLVGARRDPQWGPVLLLGFGGIWAEIISDVKLLAGDASDVEITQAIRALRGAKILTGARGKPPADIAALTDVVGRLAALMRVSPQLSEVEINPLVVFAEGRGVLALDALFVTNSPS
jgi:acetate---CoA ligase (ADP-forming)